MGVKVQAQASLASPSMTSEVDGGATRDGDVVRCDTRWWHGSKQWRIKMRRKEQRIDEDLRSACGKAERKGEQRTTGPKLHLECSQANGKAHQPTALFGGRANIFRAVHG
jgi:hypothetical protein